MTVSCRDGSAGVAAKRRLSQEGFTFVELLVSMVVLAVILTATAASLIAFARQALENERRVQATAELGALQEQIQGIPWGWVGVYYNEVKELAELIENDEVQGIDALVFDEDNDVFTYQGEDLVLIPGPDGPDDEYRVDFVPRALEFGRQVEGVDDRSYDVFQFVTEVCVRDCTGGPDDEPDVRRFHTIVRWEVRGRWFEQVFVSDRAPTTGELAALNEPPIRQFLVTPDPADAQFEDVNPLPEHVDLDGLTRIHNEEPMRIAARFDRGLAQADVCFFDRARYLDGGGNDIFDPDDFDPDDCDENRRFEMDGVLLGDGSLHSGFELEIEPTHLLFDDSDFIDQFVEDGDRAIKAVLVGHLGGSEYLVTDANFTFFDYDAVEGDLTGAATTDGIGSAHPQPFSTTDPALVDATQQLCDLFRITVDVDTTNVTSDDTVRLYFADRSRGLSAPNGHPQWSTLFTDGAVSPWTPQPGSPVLDIFYATATAPVAIQDGQVLRTSPFISSFVDGGLEAEFRFSPEPGGSCP